VKRNYSGETHRGDWNDVELEQAATTKPYSTCTSNFKKICVSASKVASAAFRPMIIKFWKSQEDLSVHAILRKR
jgi:hypothetical protein